MLDNTFYLIVNAVRIYVIYRFIGLFFEAEDRKKWTPLYYISFFVINSITNLFCGIDIVNLIINFGGLLLIVLIGYKGNIVRKVLAAILNLGIGVVAENIAWLLFVKDKEPYMENFGLFFFVFILLIIEFFIEKTFKVRKGIEGIYRRNVIIIFIPVGSIVIANVLIESSYDKFSWLVISLCLLLFINILLLYLYEKILEDYVSLKDKELYRLQLVMYQNQLDIMQNANETYKMMRHDIKHHMMLLADYIKNGNKENALSYIDKIHKYIGSENKYVETGNKSIDSILNYVIEEIYKMGGVVNTNIKVVENMQIDDFDMNIILSNLLFNAYEALKKCERKKLTISMKYDRGILKINIVNTYDGIINFKQGKLVSTKTQAENHGIGIASVKKIVEKYGGEVKIEYSKEEFKVKVFLYVPNNTI